MGSRKFERLQIVAIGFGAITITFIIISPWLSWSSIIVTYALLNLVFTNSILIFLITRHLHLCRLRSRLVIQWQRTSPITRSIQRRQHTDYCLFVLGSGGHTKEMLMMMDDGFSDFENLHRRYLVSSGDGMSRNHLEDHEEDLKTLCHRNGHLPGTFDTKTVHRARRVHQSLLTTPFTAALSFYDIVRVLLSPPTQGAQHPGTPINFPSIIFSNGPATGFFVALAVHILKMLYIVPEDKCLFVYIESWARISTLSLTGKLLYYTGIADEFAVQHAQVAHKYGLPNAGPLVLNARRSTAIDEPAA